MRPPTHFPWPPPRHMRTEAGSWSVTAALHLERGSLEADLGRAIESAVDRLRSACSARGVELLERPPGEGAEATVRVASFAGFAPEGYRLVLAAGGGELQATTASGLRHGLRTLAQLIEDAPPARAGIELACLTIEDEPRFAERGAMLDVSRDRVPRMDALFAQVERFADWKLNRLQLYTEHTFAYAEHEAVWRNASPFTPDEIRELDAFCRARGIELVPNQQSFGHFHRWLVHPRYRDLAECPEGVEHPFSFEREPFSLCATDERTDAFLGALYDELLPCFSSRELNVGLDETFDLGEGRSREACERDGTGRVYLDFLRRVHRLATERGARMQFWADIILHHAELVPELPRDCVPMLWGYERDHPFEKETRLVAETGLDFYVCPGTSSWQSLAGRTGNMLGNVTNAAEHGAANGARGLLITDWGDRGHLQPPIASLPGWLFGAGSAWNPEGAEACASVDGLAPFLDRRALPELFDTTVSDRSPGHALLELGRTYEVIGAPSPNANPLSLVLTTFPGPLPPPQAPELSAEGIERAAAHLESARASFVAASSKGPASPRADLLRAEFAFAADAQAFAARLGLARFSSGTGSEVTALGTAQRSRLAEEAGELLQAHRALWLESSRPGGLDDSSAWLARIRTALATP